MAQHCPTDPLDQQPDEGFTFADVTMLVFLGVTGLAIFVLVLLGTASAATRIEAVLGIG